jgi:hypothetical protein
MADSLKTRVGRVIAGRCACTARPHGRPGTRGRDGAGHPRRGRVIDDVRHELGSSSRANRHLSQQQHASLNGQHAKLAEQIDEAMAQGRDELARAAVARQLDIEAQLPVLENHAGRMSCRSVSCRATWRRCWRRSARWQEAPGRIPQEPGGCGRHGVVHRRCCGQRGRTSHRQAHQRLRPHLRAPDRLVRNGARQQPAAGGTAQGIGRPGARQQDRRTHGTTEGRQGMSAPAAPKRSCRSAQREG